MRVLAAVALFAALFTIAAANDYDQFTDVSGAVRNMPRGQLWQVSPTSQHALFNRRRNIEKREDERERRGRVKKWEIGRGFKTHCFKIIALRTPSLSLYHSIPPFSVLFVHIYVSLNAHPTKSAFTYHH